MGVTVAMTQQKCPDEQKLFFSQNEDPCSDKRALFSQKGN